MTFSKLLHIETEKKTFKEERKDKKRVIYSMIYIKRLRLRMLQSAA